MRTYHFLTASLFLSSSGLAWGQSIVSEGVLGNSGEAGQSLVRFAPKEASGLGVVVDRYGSLWDRAGTETLNRYSADGRLLAQFKIPKGSSGVAGQDKIAIVGDLLVLKLDAAVFTLPIDATAGTAPKNLNLKITRISSVSKDGWLAGGNDTEVFLFNPVNGEKKTVSTVTTTPSFIEIGSNGDVYTINRGVIEKLGDTTEDWPKKVSGDRMQWLEGAWWGHAYHSTIFRYDSEMSPAPGVVLGGASGSFIGHLAENLEISNGRGMALVRPEVFAISGWNGVLHLLQWQAEQQRMDIVRRIGSVPSASGIGLDNAGNVWWSAGSWEWSDRPDTPLRYGMSASNVSQAVMLPNDGMITVGQRNGKAALFTGRLTKELTTKFATPDWGAKIEYLGAATYLGDKNERFLLLVTPKGEARSLSITNDGGMRRDAGVTSIQTATPIKAWSSLASNDEKKLLGAGDGQIIELSRDGLNWKETSRWNSWGNGEKFGSRIWITTDAGRLWVSDRDNHRVLCFDATTRILLAMFGGTKGDDMFRLDGPETIVARGQRAVVFDSANQRLVKLSFKK